MGHKAFLQTGLMLFSNQFKKKVWIRAFLCFENLLNELLDEYDKALLDLTVQL